MLIVKNTQEELVRAREAAKGRTGPFRAPHRTVSLLGLIGELAISAGGVLWLDAANELRAGDVLTLCGTWAFMHPAHRPVVYFALETTDKVGLFEERVRGAMALSAKQWTRP